MVADRRGRAFPLSVRVTAIYTLLVAATLLVVAALSIQLTRSHLAGDLDERLAAVVEAFRSGPAARIQEPEDLQDTARVWLAGIAVSEDEVVAVRTSGGRVLRSRGGLNLEEVDGVGPVLTATRPRWWDLEDADQEIRALTAPLVIDGRQAGTLVAAASRAGQEATLSGLLSGIGIATGLGLVFATVLGIMAVRRTLTPLRRMADEVTAIQQTGDLSRRVGSQGPADEVGRLAEAFDGMLARLDEAFRSHRRFLSDASHELRTPLQVARGQLELLEEGLRGAEARRSLAVATEELERMRTIVDDLLLLARLDEGMPLRREPVEVELVVREALLRGMLLSRRESRVEIEPGLYASADPDRLLQVLTNLVTNAVRHGGEDARIDISAGQNGSRVRISVADDGPGIPPEELPHIFERLYRGTTGRTEAGGGAGLGLAIADSLTRAMGGEITVDSRPGDGTRFTVWLPTMAEGRQLVPTG